MSPVQCGGLLVVVAVVVWAFDYFALVSGVLGVIAVVFALMGVLIILVDRVRHAKR